MMKESIPAASGVGVVELEVTALPQVERFWGDYVGLEKLGERAGAAVMGAGGRELVVLHPGAKGGVVGRRSGLYHLALVVPSKGELARVVGRLAKLHWEQYPTDHVMTKANYFWDPDGNGIEIYAESPEDGYMGFANGSFAAWDKAGNPRSGRDAIDLEELFSHLDKDARLEDGLPAGSKMGHVHLHVADVNEALGFYADIVGFDVMGAANGMGFVSAGGYHHHLGLNEWAGRGAPPKPEGTAGLRSFTVELPNQAGLEAVVGRLESSGIAVREEGGGYTAVDPSANKVNFVVRTTGG